MSPEAGDQSKPRVLMGGGEEPPKQEHVSRTHTSAPGWMGVASIVMPIAAVVAVYVMGTILAVKSAALWLGIFFFLGASAGLGLAGVAAGRRKWTGAVGLVLSLLTALLITGLAVLGQRKAQRPQGVESVPPASAPGQPGGPGGAGAQMP